MDLFRRSARTTQAVAAGVDAAHGWWADDRSTTLALASQAAHKASELGHQLTPWERDGHYSCVAWCTACGFAAAVDTTNGENYIGGSTLAMPCPGRPGAAPAWHKEPLTW